MASSVRVAFVWHMHQPDYRDPVGVGDMALPWVRLHSTAAYTDMAWVLERHPQVHCTVNFSPVLVDQIEALARGRCGDRYLDLSARAAQDLSLSDRVEILRRFFMIDWERSVRPLPRYWELLHRRGRDLKALDVERVAESFSVEDFRDLQVLFNLAWTGFAAREEDEVVKNLIKKGQGFTEVEKELLLEQQMELVAEVLPRWRRLGESGQVELSASPYFHPILPLVVDTACAGLRSGRTPAPPHTQWPELARAQVAMALARHAETFGAPPSGMWPSEGAVCPMTCAILAGEGLAWCASDEEVLKKSDADDGPIARGDVYRPWTVGEEGREIAVVFRDRRLSDHVGFTYARNPPDQAVRDFLTRLSRIARDAGDEAPLVTLVLDGENPWEHYPDSGRDFLLRLHEALARGEAPGGVTVHSTTVRAALEQSPPRRHLARLHAGSWIEASFRIWAGHEETDRAWQLVGEAVAALCRHEAHMAKENYDEALRHLLAAQSSDWLWWYGEDFTTETPEIFDELFRAHLVKVFELTGEATPAALRRPLSQAAAGAYRSAPLRDPSGPFTPILRGYGGPRPDWYRAGVYRPPASLGSMYQATHLVEQLLFGADLTELFLRVDLSDEGRRRALGPLRVELLSGDRSLEIELPLLRGEESSGLFRSGESAGARAGRICFGDIVEVALPFEALALPRGERVLIALRLLEDGVEVERLPRYGHVSVLVPATPPLGTGGAWA